MDDKNTAAIWNQRYRDRYDVPQATEVLKQNLHLLPESGTALDIACGLGNNALLLANRGLRTSAWDISATAIHKLQAFCKSLDLQIDSQVRDVEARPPEPDSFDVITVSRFLVRDLADPITHALRPGGLLFYQTFTRDKVDSSGPSNPEFLLDRNELLHLFPKLLVRVYREEGVIGRRDSGFRNSAILVGQKKE